MSDKEKIESPYSYEYSPLIQTAVDGLRKIASAILFDGKIDDYEVDIIRKWVNENDEILTGEPLSSLKKLFKDINADNIIDTKEREKLLLFLDAIASQDSRGTLLHGLFTKNPEIVFQNKEFVFTGELQFGSVKKAKKVLKKLNGIFSEKISPSTDYLVIGMMLPDVYNDHTKDIKTAKAVQLNNKNKAQIIIIREADFVNGVLKKHRINS
ncbi:MAG: hypothetical protein K9J16_10215 [Melioribacteraceae bacterium]|nr:hypothetical protein [Melioribacteraceae bacterium]MCF8353387.1 hypothetical protein [Melioribacteraceae bacterium]MCF8393034.1 hypothetical protein [Melioribacteraceae bacterium]MCF8419113.1 hypothetical protein [Melioribacteraceae bacterium]